MFGSRIWELHQDCNEIFKEDGPSTNGVENSSSMSHSSSIPSPIPHDRCTYNLGITDMIRCSL